MGGWTGGHQRYIPAGCLHRSGAGNCDCDSNAYTDSETYTNAKVSAYPGTAPVALVDEK